MVALFLVSFGASAGATVLVSAEESETADVAAQPSATRSPSPSASATTAPTPSVTPTPEPSPSEATKRQVKSATTALCKEESSALPDLSQGDANPRWIRVWETQVFKQGSNPGPIDGVFDDQTVTGTKKVQRALGVKDTGNVNSSTWAALWMDECYVAPEPAPTYTWTPSTSSGSGNSSGSGQSSSSGGGGTLDRVE